MSSRRQRGVGLVAAIFLVVVVALLAAFLVSVATTSRTSSALGAVETRARYAAQGGLEWAAQRLLANPGAASCDDDFPASFTLTGGATGGFRISASCRQTPIKEGPVAYSVFDVVVVAEVGDSGGDDYFRRELAASVVVIP